MHWFLKFILGLKLEMFRTVPLSIIRSFSLYTQQWYMSYRFADSLQAGSGWNCVSQIYSWYETLHVSDSSSVHYQEFFTVHTAMVYVIQVCWQLASRIRMELHFSNLFLVWNSTCFGQFLCPSSGVPSEFHPDPARKLLANLYDLYHCCVYSEKLLIMDRGTVRNI